MTSAYERHILEVFDPQEHRSIVLEAGTYSLGRDPINSIVLHSQRVSRQHAYIYRVPKGSNEDGYYYHIVDGNLAGQRSTNGIKVNGEKVCDHQLQNGDRIEFSPDTDVRYYIRPMTEEEIRQYTESVASGHLSAQPQDKKKTDVVLEDVPETNDQQQTTEPIVAKTTNKFPSLTVILVILGIIVISIGLIWQFKQQSSPQPETQENLIPE